MFHNPVMVALPVFSLMRAIV